MKIIATILFSVFLISCQNSDSSKTNKFVPEMYEVSEMTHLMRSIYKENEVIKKEIVSGGMFFNNGFVCSYGSSASKRELFHKPIFHNILWSSFLFAKQNKFQYFLIKWGDIKKKNTKKENSINLFKDGFGGENQLTLNLILK